MNTLHRAAVLGCAVSLFAIGQAAAAPCTIYNDAFGTSTFPGTYIGTVGMGSGEVCQLGYTNESSLARVDDSHNPSIYEFYFAGGNLKIDEKLGNNGTGKAIYVELFSYVDPSELLLASMTIPYTSAPSATYTLYNSFLDAGYYSLKNFFSDGQGDPKYQVNFTVTSAAVPEPASLALLGSALAGLGLLRRRRQSTTG